eukprot:TRINITY_DN2615_c0_g1_i13.p3 TRINITY_DN2615_c0_g1~~TRINITY_DN2615_c0_g1_i13.p3  ORF type:complete len:117 (-),score=16.96 TRINITY_DN2615_c0_g1_i13:243-593(-)
MSSTPQHTFRLFSSSHQGGSTWTHAGLCSSSRPGPGAVDVKEDAVQPSVNGTGAFLATETGAFLATETGAFLATETGAFLATETGAFLAKETGPLEAKEPCRLVVLELVPCLFCPS